MSDVNSNLDSSNTNTAYQSSVDFTDTNNSVNGITTNEKVYNNGVSWNVGNYSPTGDGEVNAQIYMPDHIDENTQIVVYYKGMDQDYSSKNCVSANDLYSDSNTILIFPGGSYYSSGEQAANTLNSLSEIIPGDWDNVTVAGVSAGGGSAFSLARNYSVAEDGTYNYHISTLSLGDSYHPERDMYCIPNSDEDYLAMIDKGITLVGVTSDGDNGNPDAVRVFRRWASLGGNSFYIDYAVSHDGKCITPYYNNYLNWILGKGDLTDEFIEQLNHFYVFEEDPETGEWVKKEISYEEATKHLESMARNPIFELSEVEDLYSRLKDDNALYNSNIKRSIGNINSMLTEFLATDAGFLGNHINAIISKVNNTKIRELTSSTSYSSTTNSPLMQDVKIMEYTAKTSELLSKVLNCVEYAMHAQLEIEATENDIKDDAADLDVSGSTTDAVLAGSIAGLDAAADALGYTGTKKQEYIESETAKLYEKYFSEEAQKEAENKGLSGEEKDKFVDEYINDRIKEFENNKDNYNVDVETNVSETNLNGEVVNGNKANTNTTSNNANNVNYTNYNANYNASNANSTVNTSNNNVNADVNVESNTNNDTSDASTQTKPSENTYIVQPGDTLGKIAKQFGMDYNDIAKDNNISDPNYILPGQKLIINNKNDLL